MSYRHPSPQFVVGGAGGLPHHLHANAFTGARIRAGMGPVSPVQGNPLLMAQQRPVVSVHQLTNTMNMSGQSMQANSMTGQRMSQMQINATSTGGGQFQQMQASVMTKSSQQMGANMTQQQRMTQIRSNAGMGGGNTNVMVKQQIIQQNIVYAGGQQPRMPQPAAPTMMRAPQAVIVNPLRSQMMNSQRPASMIIRPMLSNPAHGRIRSPLSANSGFRRGGLPQHSRYGSSSTSRNTFKPSPSPSPSSSSSSVKSNLKIAKELDALDKKKDGKENGESMAEFTKTEKVESSDSKCDKIPENGEVNESADTSSGLMEVDQDDVKESNNASSNKKMTGLSAMVSKGLKIKSRSNCCICSGSYSLTRKLKGHVQLYSYMHSSMFDSLKKHRCDTCGKGFVKNYSLLLHQRIHQQNKVMSIQCDACGKMLPSRLSLRGHMRLEHPEEIPLESLDIIVPMSAAVYKCDVCQRTCRTKQHLQNHLIRHKGLKDGVCEKCILSVIANVKQSKKMMFKKQNFFN